MDNTPDTYISDLCNDLLDNTSSYEISPELEDLIKIELFMRNIRRTYYEFTPYGNAIEADIREKFYTKNEIDANYATKNYVDEQIEEKGGGSVPANLVERLEEINNELENKADKTEVNEHLTTLDNRVDYLYEHGVTPEQPKDPKTHILYYGFIDTLITDLSSQLSLLTVVRHNKNTYNSGSAANFTLTNVLCDAKKYIYVLCEKNKHLTEVKTENNETLTDEFIEKINTYQIQVDDENVEYHLYEYTFPRTFSIHLNIKVS